ncbi:MAG TPA: hypothetical protein VF698_07505 [Thermoanaerobaculia bacterium]|jgi:hypothetical protein
MNLYVFFAIALGALTGVTNTATLAPAVVLRRSSDRRAQAPARKQVLLRTHHPRSRGTHELRSSLAAFRADAPLSGAATPRAPATTC